MNRLDVIRVSTALRSADLVLFGHLYGLGQRRFIIPAAKALSRSGDGYLHLLAPLLLVAIGSARAPVICEALALALLCERVLYYCLKNVLRRRRPADYLPDFRSIIKAADRFSFPSGHSSAAFLLVTVMCLGYGGGWGILLLWACGVGLSRVVLGVHFPGDVLAGAAMGSGIAWLATVQAGII